MNESMAKLQYDHELDKKECACMVGIPSAEREGLNFILEAE